MPGDDHRSGAGRRLRAQGGGPALAAATRAARRILPPDDALLRAVIVKLFVDRQIVVDLAVVEAIALRIDRSLASARDVVAELDRDALGRGRRITKPLALAVLDRLGMAEAGDDADGSDDEAG